jgi:hypothetical protein
MSRPLASMPFQILLSQITIQPYITTAVGNMSLKSYGSIIQVF